MIDESEVATMVVGIKQQATTMMGWEAAGWAWQMQAISPSVQGYQAKLVINKKNWKDGA